MSEDIVMTEDISKKEETVEVVTVVGVNTREVRVGYYCYKCDSEFKEPRVEDPGRSITERCPNCASSLIRRGPKSY